MAIIKSVVDMVAALWHQAVSDDIACLIRIVPKDKVAAAVNAQTRQVAEVSRVTTILIVPAVKVAAVMNAKTVLIVLAIPASVPRIAIAHFAVTEPAQRLIVIVILLQSLLSIMTTRHSL